MDYYVKDVIDVLDNVNRNPYGIKDSFHEVNRAKLRDINLNDVNNYIGHGSLVGIEKSLNENSIFQLLYEHTETHDLAIVINILSEEEIVIISIIGKKLIRGVIMEIKEYNAEYTYDSNLDVINIEVKQDIPHKETIELEFGVFLDFNQNDLPINIEIISASKIINVDKKSLCNPNGNVTVIVGSDLIEVKILFKFENGDELVNFKVLNDLPFSVSETNLALV